MTTTQLPEPSMNSLTDRFAALAPPDLTSDVGMMVIGCGTYGSAIARMLTSLGIRYALFMDPDLIEDVNVLPQLWPHGCIGMPKADTLLQICNNLLPMPPTSRIAILNRAIMQPSNTALPTPWHLFTAPASHRIQLVGTVPSRFVVVSGADDMDVTSAIYSSLVGRLQSFPHNRFLLLDARLTALQAWSLICDPHDPTSRAAYARTLFPQHNAAPPACGLRFTGPTAYAVASLQAIQVLHWLRGSPTVPSTLIDLSLGMVHQTPLVASVDPDSNLIPNVVSETVRTAVPAVPATSGTSGTLTPKY
jgi:hypothetical protein